jgi:TonB family protein
VHLFVVIMLSTSPKWAFPGKGVIVMSPDMNQKDMTYLELPPDVQKLTEKPKTNILSDKDRVATSKTPTVNQKELHRIIDSGRRGPPGPPNPQPVAPPQQQMAQAAPPPQPQQSNQSGNGIQTPPSQNQTAKLESVPGGGMSSRNNNPFAAATSAGSAIDQAARATAGGRTGSSGSGGGGDYGTGFSRQGSAQVGPLDILSDTQGVDFGPYLERVLSAVRRNWYLLIPEVARPPMMKRGKVSIEFAIQNNGQIAGMRLVGQSGDISLDRAAWGGITASNPFPPLPSEFHGSYLALRFHFYYNPAKGEIQ